MKNKYDNVNIVISQNLEEMFLVTWRPSTTPKFFNNNYHYIKYYLYIEHFLYFLPINIRFLIILFYLFLFLKFDNKTKLNFNILYFFLFIDLSLTWKMFYESPVK